MDRNRTILIGFLGPDIKQDEKVFDIGQGYECWNLKKFTLDEFIDALKEKIPPINDNVLRNYKLTEKSIDIWGITEEDFSKCSWALFIPDCISDAVTEGYSEALFLLNLFSPSFLYPFFYVEDMGITRPTINRRGSWMYTSSWHEQNQAHLFKTDNFVNFFKTLIEESGYGSWMLYRAQQWEKEDWRLFVACRFFSNLKDYDDGRDPFEWQRESAEMGATLESLFTSGDNTKDEIVYRLTKRISAIMSGIFPDIEKDIKDLYKQRSAFVHGDFFNQIAKESQHSFNNIPSIDFDVLMKQREYVRWALTIYLFLFKKLKTEPGNYPPVKNVLQLIEGSIIDTSLREKLLQDIDFIVQVLPHRS